MQLLSRKISIAFLGVLFYFLFFLQPLNAQVPSGYFTWDNATVYFLLNDRFNNGDVGNDTNYGRTADPVAGFLGGDLAGITQKINSGYFNDLGVNAIWFTAPYEQIHGAVPGYWCGNYPCVGQEHYGYHGYYALDFTEMDANMGTVADMQAFVDAAHNHGIRVIMDIVLNHVGYETTADATEFGFGPIGDPWQVPNNGLDATDPGWCNWWTDTSGESWIRKAAAGEYCSPAQGGGDLTLALAGLPDIRTDLVMNVGLPQVLLTKWDATKETQETNELNTFFTNTGLTRNPANHIIKWLTDWVRDYGIDGFRIDTYKHVERTVWGELSDQAQDAFDDWKTANPLKVLDDNDFWMVGEWYGHGPGRNADAADVGKTDALINFNFKGPAADPSNIESTYANYSGIVTNNPDWTFLNYISSHDDGMFDRNNLFDAGTSLLLAPGNAQIYYGDESQRQLGNSGSDQDTRSFMNWGSTNASLLAHWQKLGKFREKHPSIGAGIHTQLMATPYAFKREYQGAGFQDLAICIVDASGATALDVSNTFPDGTEVRDFYTGDVTTVSGGQITFTAHANGVILIEETNPIARPTISMTPDHNTFDATSITVTITVTDLSDPNPTIYYTTDTALPTNDLAGWTTYAGPINLVTSENVRAVAVNANSGRSSVLSNNYYVGTIPGFTVYFKKPAAWGANVNIHYWDIVPTTAPTAWPGVSMTLCGDWYEYELSGVLSANVIFNDGSAQTADLIRDTEGYYDGITGTWYDNPPMGFDCTCPADVDNDGVCSTVDCDDNNPNIPTTPGTVCDDGDGSTNNDQIQADGCTCAGCPTDVDLDGICATDDCDDSNPNIPTTPGASCDDGDANTVNDQIQADSCTCTGSGDFIVYFKKPSTWASTIKVHYWDQELDANVTIWPGEDMTQCSVNTDWWYFTFTGTSSTNLIFHDNNGQQTADLNRSSDGWYDTSWSNIAPISFSCDACAADVDNDGICASMDCDDNNPNIPALSGTPCDDGDPNTTGEQIQADGCTCAAGAGFIIYFKKPAAWTGSTMNVYYWDNMPGATSNTWPGIAMTQCSVNTDWWYYTFDGTMSTNLIFNDHDGTGNSQTADLFRDADGWYDHDNTTWASTPPSMFSCDACSTDVDNDGVCADIDCDDNDGNVPTTVGSACNDGNPNTTNDQIQEDGCTCAGLAEFTVYFKKPANWATPVKLHYWNKQPGGTASAWPGVDMTVCPANSDWYFYTFTNTSSTNLLFHDNSGQQTADLTQNTDSWYDGGWGAMPNGFNCTACTIDMDNDGACSDVDCDDNDPSVPAPPGTACNDSDANTSNDQIQAGGCTCAGFTDFTVYFKKPTTWASTVKIHYWDQQPSNTATDWPGVDMAVCGNGWWSYTFSATSSTNLLFHDDTGNQTDDLFRSSGGWYDGSWGSAGSCSQGGVIVSPATPSPDEIVTVTFDATGSDLEGAAKVYFHSGVSVTVNDVTSFDYSLGNWGQDDGIGEMTNMGGNIWQFVINPSLRTFYNVATTDDLFGMNFLFRSADGSLQEDNSGANYFNPVSTGAYFTITNPAASPYLAPINNSFNLVSEANTTPTSWTLEELDVNDNVIATLGTQTGGINYTEAITLTTAIARWFKVTANFASGVKYKLFQAQGYGPVCTIARPAWTKPGINYHVGDPTKATLVLHAPTYIQYKKGTGVISGTSTTTSKDVVHVIGDFNNWTISESYKLCRDTDGWNGTTDADGDDDRGDYWWIELTGLTPGQEYIFQYLIEGNLQVADPYAEKISDVEDTHISTATYPGLIAYRTEAGGKRASVLQTDQAAFVWTAPAFTPPSTNNLNIYELHFRDFTEEGTYLAAIDKLDYLKSLGINAIHVMPVSEFEGNNSWGYNPNFYFGPDKAYGLKDDLKKFINECHQREMQVFNDLVLNHSFYSNVMARLYWNDDDNRPADDNPWFNAYHKAVASPDGWWGADWNHESEHTQKMMDRVLDFWLQEYNFDGFRFDFTKGITQTAQDVNDPWASSYDQDRIDLLKRLIDNMWNDNPGSVAIFEHLAWASEDKELADYGILMWSGAGHHGAIKNFLLGYDQDNPNIYDSGIFDAPARNFNFANWMSYMESHDEERQAYEVLSHGNTIFNEPNTSVKLQKTIDRLKLGASFNLLFPGPRMLWQFEELAYDVSINFNGRTGEKPVRWEYFEDPTRQELFRQMSTLLYLRNNYNLYPIASPPNYDNISWGANAITTPRRMTLSDNAGKHVIVIGNLDPMNSNSATPGYPLTGTWYRYNGDPAIDGTSFTVNNTGETYALTANEVMVLTNFQVSNPVLDGNNINVASRMILGGAYDNDTGLMRDDLRTGSHIPMTEPYTGLGYTFISGGGNESINSSILTTSGEDAIVDWVVLELRDKATPATVVKSRSALLQRDGDIVDLDGKSTTVAFDNIAGGYYYLTIRHRNHLSVSSAIPVFLNYTACAIDFSKNTTMTWGTNAQKIHGNGRMGLWPGDANRDGKIIYSGANTDVNTISFKVLNSPSNPLGFPFAVINGYNQEDIDLNGKVIYSGANTDVNIISFNVFLFPGNFLSFPFFSINQQQP